MSRVDPATGEKLAGDDDLDEDGAPPIRPFADFLREQSDGELHDEVSAALHDVIAAVTGTGKPASVTLSVSVKPGKRDKYTAAIVGVRVHGEVKTKLPRVESEESQFFVDGAGNLTRRNPEQPPLPGILAGPGTDRH